MKTTLRVSAQAVVFSGLALFLSGCESSDLAYFNVAVQCQSAYPNDSWAQQQCMNRGASIIQSYEAEQRCDNAVNAMRRDMDEFNRFTIAAEKTRAVVYDQVNTFRTTFVDCAINYRFNQCTDAHSKVILANIDLVIHELNEQERWDYDIANTQAQLRQSCSAYWDLGSYQVDTHYNENRRIFNLWKKHIEDTVNELVYLYW